MNGLSDNHIYNYIMNEWNRLFIEQNRIHSDQKYAYWENAQKYKFPNFKDEKWKYLPLKKLVSYKFVNSSPNHDISESDRKYLNLKIESYQLVFVNGFFSKELSSQNFGPWKIKILNRNTNQILPKPIQPEFFLYLTECLSHETIHISLPDNKKSKIPLYLLHINQCPYNKNILTTFHYRHHIEIHDNSYGKIIEHYTSLGNSNYFNSSRTSIIMGSNTKIEHIKLSLESQKSFHISHNDVHLNYNSIIQSNIFNMFGSHFIRHQTSALLNDQLSSISLNSLLLPLKQDINDISTYIKHKHPGYNISRQIHKIISGNQGQGIFKGLIQVDKKAIKVDGNMLNKNLLLDPSSKIYSIPQLEIYSDDVKCTHGATTGHLDHEQIFYLCSRGISYQQAFQMIVYAFAFEIIEKVKDKNIQKEISNYIVRILKRTFYNDISHTKDPI